MRHGYAKSKPMPTERDPAEPAATDVTISRIGVDKYGGRVGAAAATRTTADVSADMLAGGFARAYDGGRRGTWCG